MIKRTTELLALASLGLFLVAPVHAAPHFVDDVIVVAKRDQVEDVRQDSRDSRRDDHRSHRRDVERDTPPGYGYGYERRQQERHERFEEDSRSRGRR